MEITLAFSTAREALWATPTLESLALQAPEITPTLLVPDAHLVPLLRSQWFLRRVLLWPPGEPAPPEALTLTLDRQAAEAWEREERHYLQILRASMVQQAIQQSGLGEREVLLALGDRLPVVPDPEAPPEWHAAQAMAWEISRRIARRISLSSLRPRTALSAKSRATVRRRLRAHGIRRPYLLYHLPSQGTAPLATALLDQLRASARGARAFDLVDLERVGDGTPVTAACLGGLPECRAILTECDLLGDVLWGCVTDREQRERSPRGARPLRLLSLYAGEDARWDGIRSPEGVTLKAEADPAGILPALLPPLLQSLTDS